MSALYQVFQMNSFFINSISTNFVYLNARPSNRNQGSWRQLERISPCKTTKYGVDLAWGKNKLPQIVWILRNFLIVSFFV